MLLSNTSVKHLPRISALAAAAPNRTVCLDQSANDDFLGAVTYRKPESVVKQCEKAAKSTSNVPLSASSAGTSCNSRRSRSSGFRRPSNAALKRHPCRTCDKYGH